MKKQKIFVRGRRGNIAQDPNSLPTWHYKNKIKNYKLMLVTKTLVEILGLQHFVI